MDLNSISLRIDDEISATVPPQIAAAARVIHAELGDAVAAVLFYGSALREGSFDGKVIDLYALVDAYRPAYGKMLPAAGNRILPPNVYYHSSEGGGRTIRLKFAVVSLEQFYRRAGGGSFTPYFWGRFAQPTAIVYARDEEVRNRIAETFASAVCSVLRTSAPLMTGEFSSAELWTRAFRESYRTELRAEGKSRAAELYDVNRDRYDALTTGASALGLGFRATGTDGRYVGTATRAEIIATHAAWILRRPAGKILSVLRLLKAAFTFKGGVDYILWKVERHSGVKVVATDWQRRHPLLAAVSLSWRLYVRGGFR